MNNVEVVGIDTDTFSIHAVVHLYAGKDGLPNIPSSIKKTVENMVDYMETEGFLPTKKLWTIKTGILVHPPKNK